MDVSVVISSLVQIVFCKLKVKQMLQHRVEIVRILLLMVLSLMVKVGMYRAQLLFLKRIIGELFLRQVVTWVLEKPIFMMQQIFVCVMFR